MKGRTSTVMDAEKASISESFQKYQPWTRNQLAELADKHPEFSEVLTDVQMASRVFPFRLSSHVIDNLIRWGDLEEDPFFHLLIPTMKMLEEGHREALREVCLSGDESKISSVVNSIRADLNPHPADQMTLNTPDGEDNLNGVQHKYPETVLLFPSAGQTCHAYCTYCFRWAQFIGDSDLRFAQKEAEYIFSYLQKHREVTDVLVTGGDPMVMRTKMLQKYLEPFCDSEFLPHINTIRFGSRALTFWPKRFTEDEDSNQLLAMFRRLISAGRHVAFMAHIGHPRELESPTFKKAVKRIQRTGAVIRSQAPLIAGFNDSADLWAQKWRKEVNLGIVPYYMFIARDTGAQHYFKVPLSDAVEIYQEAVSNVTGLARTVREPSMSCGPGKVSIDGISEIDGVKVFVLRFLQCREPELVGRPFFAKFDEHAAWFDELEPIDGQALPWNSNGRLKLPSPLLRDE
jgi:KamA family protein